MINKGSKVLVKHGLFYGYEGLVNGSFHYNGSDINVVTMHRGKNISETFTTTASDNELEILH